MMTLSLPLLVFYLLAGLLLTSASLTVFSRSPVHAVLFLIVAFFNAACLLLMLGAEFLGMILLIVYIGAVAVLFLFVVMMLQTGQVSPRRALAAYAPAGLFVAVVLLAELLLLFASPFAAGDWAASPQGASAVLTPPDVSNSAALGAVLYTRYVHFFQIAGMVLLSAMVAAIVLTLRHRPGIKRQNPAEQTARTREESIEIRKVSSGQGVGR